MSDSTMSDNLMDAMLKIKEILDAIPKPEFDVIVTTEKAWDKAAEALPVKIQYNEYWPSLIGIPIYIKEDEIEAVRSMLLLMEEGKRVAYLMEDLSLKILDEVYSL